MLHTVDYSALDDLDSDTTMTLESVLLSIPEAAQCLRVSRTQTYRLIERGDLDRVKIGARALIPAASIKGYIERLVAAAHANKQASQQEQEVDQG